MLFWRGLAVGLAIAAPVGPIGLLCIQRTLSAGYRAGLLTGLGAATADAIYGGLAAFGVVAVTHVLVKDAPWIHAIGGTALAVLGIRMALRRGAARVAGIGGAGYLGHYLGTVGLTLANPLTIVAFLAVFASLGLRTAAGAGGSALEAVAGVAAGSALWWVLLTGGVSLLRRRVTQGMLGWVNRTAGLVILAFAAASLAGAFRG